MNAHQKTLADLNRLCDAECSLRAQDAKNGLHISKAVFGANDSGIYINNPIGSKCFAADDIVNITITSDSELIIDDTFGTRWRVSFTELCSEATHDEFVAKTGDVDGRIIAGHLSKYNGATNKTLASIIFPHTNSDCKTMDRYCELFFGFEHILNARGLLPESREPQQLQEKGLLFKALPCNGRCHIYLFVIQPEKSLSFSSYQKSLIKDELENLARRV